MAHMLLNPKDPQRCQFQEYSERRIPLAGSHFSDLAVEFLSHLNVKVNMIYPLLSDQSVS